MSIIFKRMCIVTDQDRIIALEREVIDTRNAAVGLIAGWLDANHPTPSAKRDAAQWFDSMTSGADVETARLARLVAGALRRM
jgi:hypothetical protein